MRPYSTRTTAPTNPLVASSTTMPISTGFSTDFGRRLWCGLRDRMSLP
jgi:hypothetical protein